MKTLLSASCDQALSGLAHQFTEWHVGHCPRCTAALVALRALKERLRVFFTLPAEDDSERLTPDRWTRLETAWAEAERRT